MARDAMSEPRGVGRPSIYTRELGALICERVANTSFGLKKLCKLYPDMPNPDTVNDWRSKFTEFSVLYAEAKRKQADLLAEEIIEIADDGQNDWMQTEDDEGGLAWKINGEHVQRSKLRMDARKWLAGKLSPKIYGVITPDDKKGGESEIEKMMKEEA